MDLKTSRFSQARGNRFGQQYADQVLKQGVIGELPEGGPVHVGLSSGVA